METHSAKIINGERLNELLLKRNNPANYNMENIPIFKGYSNKEGHVIHI